MKSIHSHPANRWLKTGIATLLMLSMGFASLTVQPTQALATPVFDESVLYPHSYTVPATSGSTIAEYTASGSGSSHKVGAKILSPEDRVVLTFKETDLFGSLVNIAPGVGRKASLSIENSTEREYRVADYYFTMTHYGNQRRTVNAAAQAQGLTMPDVTALGPSAWWDLNNEHHFQAETSCDVHRDLSLIAPLFDGTPIASNETSDEMTKLGCYYLMNNTRLSLNTDTHPIPSSPGFTGAQELSLYSYYAKNPGNSAMIDDVFGSTVAAASASTNGLPLNTAFLANGATISNAFGGVSLGFDLTLVLDATDDAPEQKTAPIPSPTVEKIVTGDTPLSNELFTFSMIPDPSNPATASVETSAQISGEGTRANAFGAAEFSAPGTYKFAIRENAGYTEGYSYDSTLYTWTVVAEEENGALAVSSTTLTKQNSVAALERATFTNTFIASELEELETPTPTPPPTKPAPALGGDRAQNKEIKRAAHKQATPKGKSSKKSGNPLTADFNYAALASGALGSSLLLAVAMYTTRQKKGTS